MTHSEKAGALFREGYGCCQSVFAAFDDLTGLDRNTALRLASGFGGGMGRMREVCGVLTGCYLVLGMLRGYTDPADDNGKAALYHDIQALSAQFRERHNTLLCRDLLAGVSTDCSPHPTVRTADFYTDRPCMGLVEEAAALLESFLSEESDRHD